MHSTLLIRIIIICDIPLSHRVVVMYVCICQAVTDTQIRTAVEGGCCSMRGLRQELGVASCCGKCAPMARDILRETLDSEVRQHPERYPAAA